MKKIISTDQAPAAIGPYSQAIKTNGSLLFVSGQIPLDPKTGNIVEGGIVAQTTRVLDSLKAILTAADCTLDSVIKTTVYLKNISDFATVNEVYAKYFTQNCPARVCVEVANLPKDALVEIDVIAAAAE